MDLIATLIIRRGEWLLSLSSSFYVQLRFRIKDLKGKTKGTKSPNKPIVLLVLMILECLKSGAKSERDIKDFVTEKCRKCGIKATNRGTIAGR